MKHFVFAVMLCMFALACSDSLYDQTLTDHNSGAAREEALEIAINEKNYNKVIDTLGSENMNDLTLREKYLLQSAYLGAAGFDPIENLDELMKDDSTENVMLILLGEQGDIDALSAADKSEYYRLAADIHTNYNPTNDEDILLAGSVASSMQIITSVAEVSTSIGGCEVISFDENEPNYIGNCISESGPAAIAPLVPMIQDGLNIIDTLVQDEELKGKVQEKFQEILNDIGGINATADDVFNYLVNQVFN